MVNEQQESFYSYTPWWSGADNRTMVFFASVIFNKVLFYIDVNDYPMWFESGWSDWQDMAAIYPWDPHYGRTDSYFMRVRPDYALYDLISQKQYIFNFYAFSQQQNNTWIDLQCNENITGFANQSTTFYRHYNLQYDATYIFTVTPVIGNPTLLLAVSDTETWVNVTDGTTYNHISSNAGTAKETIILTFDMRLTDSVNCDFGGYPLNGGNTLCRTWVGVYCSAACVYNISVAI